MSELLKRYSLKIVLLAFCALHIGCSKQSTKEILRKGPDNENIGIASLIKDYQTPRNGEILLEKYHGIRGGQMYASGTFQDENGDRQNFEKLWLGGELIPENGGGFSDTEFNGSPFFGSEMEVKIENSAGELVIHDSLYIPQLISVEFPSVLAPGAEITWNVDPNDPMNYIGVDVLYDPGNPYNSGTEGYKIFSNTEYIQNDQGNYNLPASLFEGIPDGEWVSIKVSRLTYTMLTLDTEASFLTYPMAFSNAHTHNLQVEY